MKGYDGWWDANSVRTWVPRDDPTKVVTEKGAEFLPERVWREDGKRHWLVDGTVYWMVNGEAKNMSQEDYEEPCAE